MANLAPLLERICTLAVQRDLEWGTGVSVEGLQQGFTHCFFVSFRSEADRTRYLPRPAHKEFGQILGPHLDKVLVIDYWTKLGSRLPTFEICCHRHEKLGPSGVLCLHPFGSFGILLCIRE